MSVCFCPYGKQVASGSSDNSIKIWDSNTGDCESTLSGHKDPIRSVCFSPCGTKIVSGGGLEEDVGGNGDFAIRIWDAEMGTQTGSPLNGHSGYVTPVSYSCVFSNVWCALTIEQFTGVS